MKTHNMSPLEVYEIENAMPTNRQKRMETRSASKSNVAIAAAITAYARVERSKHMKDETNPVFYHDTDSIVRQNPLPAEVVGKELGQMKLEYQVIKGVFAGPKLYSRVTSDAKEVIKAKGYGSKGLKHENFEGLRKGERLQMKKEY
jgi:hypothetical protein